MMLPFLARCEHMWPQHSKLWVQGQEGYTRPYPCSNSIPLPGSFHGFSSCFFLYSKVTLGLIQDCMWQSCLPSAKQSLLSLNNPLIMYTCLMYIFTQQIWSVVLPNLNLQAHLFSAMPAWPGSLHLTYSIDPASLLVYLQLHLLHHSQSILSKNLKLFSLCNFQDSFMILLVR